MFVLIYTNGLLLLENNLNNNFVFELDDFLKKNLYITNQIPFFILNPKSKLFVNNSLIQYTHWNKNNIIIDDTLSYFVLVNDSIYKTKVFSKVTILLINSLYYLNQTILNMVESNNIFIFPDQQTIMNFNGLRTTINLDYSTDALEKFKKIDSSASLVRYQGIEVDNEILLKYKRYLSTCYQRREFIRFEESLSFTEFILSLIAWEEETIQLFVPYSNYRNSLWTSFNLCEQFQTYKLHNIVDLYITTKEILCAHFQHDFQLPINIYRPSLKLIVDNFTIYSNLYCIISIVKEQKKFYKPYDLSFLY